MFVYHLLIVVTAGKYMVCNLVNYTLTHAKIAKTLHTSADSVDTSSCNVVTYVLVQLKTDTDLRNDLATVSAAVQTSDLPTCCRILFL